MELVWLLPKSVFVKLKTALTSNLTLTDYNPNKQYVASNTSNFDLGVVLQHKEEDGKLKLIHHASRTLLPAEMNNLQIEKEGLPIIFAIKKFHKYIYGREFVLQTDHYPLLAIFGSKKGEKIYFLNYYLGKAT